jgi:hypothetical protein
LANQLLKDRLAPHGYTKCNNHTPGLWQYKTQAIKFVLVVNEFGIKYSTLQDAQHLLAALKQHYEAIAVDWEGTLYCSILLNWNYERRTVDLSMPGSIQMALDDFNFTQTNRAEHQPHRHNPPQYGVKTQLTDLTDVTAPLDDKGNLRLQQITRKFQYYSWAVDPSMNVTLSTIASQQTRGTQQTQKDANKFLHYCSTHPDAKLHYHASNTILKVHLDTSYNSEPKVHSQAGGHFYMGNQGTNDNTHQGAILATTSIINLADYYTKHHSPAHHQLMGSSYLHMDPVDTSINSAITYALHALRGCAKPAPWNTMVPRVQGSQHMHINTPAGQRAIASKAQAALSHARGGRCETPKLVA